MRILLLLLLIFWIGYCQEQTLETHEHEQLTTAQAWGFGMLAGIGLIIFGLIIGNILECLQHHIAHKHFTFMVNLFYAFACGLMIGEVLIHSLPSAYRSSQTKIQIVALLVMAAICFFILLERSFKRCGKGRTRWGAYDHEHGDNQMTLHQHYQTLIVSKKEIKRQLQHRVKRANTMDIGQSSENINGNTNKPIKAEELQNKVDHSHVVKKASSDEESQDSFWDKLRQAGSDGILDAVMALVGNFFDGFAIGVAFGTRDQEEYVPVLVAVFAHCLPRELSDFAILVKSRFSGCELSIFSGVPKITTIIGVAIGLGLETTGKVAGFYILSFVAGFFIYIASDIWKHLFENRSCLKNVFEVLIFAFGIGIEYLFLLLQE